MDDWRTGCAFNQRARDSSYRERTKEKALDRKIMRFSFLTTKPQAMLVDEYSTSVDTVKKEPPFAKIEAGNANRTTSKRRFIHMNEKSLSHACWNCKYHIVLGQSTAERQCTGN